MRKLGWAWAFILLLAGTVSAEEKVVRYSEWKGRPVELAVDIGYAEIRVRFENRAAVGKVKNDCAEFLKKEARRLASGKVVQLGDTGYTFEFLNGSPLAGKGEQSGHDYYNLLLVFGMEAKVNGKSITAEGQ